MAVLVALGQCCCEMSPRIATRGGSRYRKYRYQRTSQPASGMRPEPRRWALICHRMKTGFGGKRTFDVMRFARTKRPRGGDPAFFGVRLSFREAARCRGPALARALHLISTSEATNPTKILQQALLPARPVNEGRRHPSLRLGAFFYRICGTMQPQPFLRTTPFTCRLKSSRVWQSATP
jgi:hypothetical protein